MVNELAVRQGLQASSQISGYNQSVLSNDKFCWFHWKLEPLTANYPGRGYRCFSMLVIIFFKMLLLLLLLLDNVHVYFIELKHSIKGRKQVKSLDRSYKGSKKKTKEQLK